VVPPEPTGTLLWTLPKSPLFGREVVKETTVVEVPPIYIYGYRAYSKSPKGLKTLGEVLLKSFPKYAERRLTVPKDYDPAKAQALVESKLQNVAELRVLALTQPNKTSVDKKTPEVLEIKVSGDDVNTAYDYIKGIVGKEIRAKDRGRPLTPSSKRLLDILAAG
jgi:large subunit ribosomal protein L3